jgi:hypothetical protein
MPLVVRVHKMIYGFGGPSKKMSVLINFQLQNLVSVLSNICQNQTGVQFIQVKLTNISYIWILFKILLRQDYSSFKVRIRQVSLRSH